MPKAVFKMPGRIDLGLMIFSRLLLVVSLGLLPLIAWQGWQWQAELFTDEPGAEFSSASSVSPFPEGENGSGQVQARLELAQVDPSQLGSAEAAIGEWLRREAGDLVRRVGQDAVASLEQEAYSKDGDNSLALARALELVFPDLDRRAYYMLWRGTVIICSPLNPELRGLDLGHLKDGRGVRFIAGLAALAGQGGGLSGFRLGEALSGSGAERGPDEISGNFLAYAAPFEDSDIYLTVWRNAGDSNGEALYGFIPAGAGKTQGWLLLSRGRLIAGLLLVQLSCLGLGILLRFGRF
ncbi:MAG: hypothetical protein LBV80_03475 [Deltaproteobacteria bacterium]|jgi:hypothetical protein|nr:hypothetical protein [Deltaproteobacteria bacterium]